jgi:hypothetical protein
MNDYDCTCGASYQPGIIYQSADTTLNFQLKTSDGKPFDLTNATEIWVMFPTLIAPPVILMLSNSTLTITNLGGGQFSGVMTSANALLLQAGNISIEIRVTIAGEITTVELTDALTVTATLFPGY